MSVTITGLADLDVAFKKFMLNTEQAVDDAVRVTAIKVQRSAIKSIREPSMGTYVTRYTAGGNPYQHVASKPGSSPNNDTGRLMGSIALDHHKGKQVAYVGTNVDYGFVCVISFFFVYTVICFISMLLLFLFYLFSIVCHECFY